MRNYITTVTKTNEPHIHPLHHRNRVIIHNHFGNFADFESIEQLEKLSNLLGFNYKLEEEQTNHPIYGTYRKYSMSHMIVEESFRNISELPEGVNPIIALSNGSLVTCYFYNDGKVITMYRPNPNDKDIYKPLEINEHIKHVKENGCY